MEIENREQLSLDSLTLREAIKAGVISEYFWKLYLNQYGDFVEETTCIDVAAQIDLIVKATGKKIEVRSSFPRNSIDFCVCHKTYQFDVLGPYSNSYKAGEIQKDYYVRTLFRMDTPTAIKNVIIQDGFSFYLTGGATWKMMWDKHFSIEKDLLPPDAHTIEKSRYRVVPFATALDTSQIRSIITGNI